MSKRYVSSWQDIKSLSVYQKIIIEGAPETLKTLPQDFLDGWISKNSGGTVFHYAVSHALSPETIVPFMVERGLDINALNGRGNGMVCHAFSRDAALCLRWFNALLLAGWDISKMVDGGAALLARAVEYNRVGLVEGLIRAGARKSPVDVLTEPYAESGISADIVRLIRLAPEDGPTASMKLVEDMLPHSREDITRLFLSAVSRGRFDWVHHLIERGANLGFRFKGGATPLHLLARHANLYSGMNEDVMTLVFDLVCLGVDPLHTDEVGETASKRVSLRCMERWDEMIRNAQAHVMMMSSSSVPPAVDRPRPRL